ncbi:cyclic pyranopterin monophosphate synthase MoaC [Elusimicrobiota bacterium]
MNDSDDSRNLSLPTGIGSWRDEYGTLKMVDISLKKPTLREAKAAGFIKINEDTLEKIKNDEIPKGNVLALAKTAGIIAAKKTPELIPMCHSIKLTHIDIKFFFEVNGIRVASSIRSVDRTGAEIEAITAVAVTLINIYDMLKALDKEMVISDIMLVKKLGGKTGVYVRTD